MLKKILIGIGLLVLAFVLFVVYNIMFPASPKGDASISANGLDIKVTYGRPYKKGRLIFGEEKDKALQPYGKYWRLGANAATEITFNKNVNFAGTPINAGSYRMYTVPGADAFEVYLNSELGVTLSAASEPNHSLDVLKVSVPVTTLPNETEQFTINFASDSVGVKMNFLWDKIQVSVPITAQ